MAIHLNINTEFPFNSLNNFELTNILETPKNRISKLLKNNRFEKYINTSTAKNLIEQHNCSYYDEIELCKKLQEGKFELTLLNMNIRSLDKHCGELSALLQNLNFTFDFITISEIGRRNIENRAMTLKDKYNIEYKLPNKGMFGGVCILIRKDLKYHLRQDLEMKSEDVEDIWIETTIQNHKTIIGSIYRHPGTNIENFTHNIEITMNTIQKETGKAFICGDYNIDGIKINVDQKTTNFYDTILSQNFLPTIMIPTRITENTATVIDNILMKLTNISLNDEIESGNLYSDITDHLPNFIILKSDQDNRFKEPKNERPMIRLQGPKNIKKFTDQLKNSFQDVLNEQQPDKILDLIYEKYNTAYENSFPMVRLSRKRMKDKKWITAGIRESIHKKAGLYKQYLNHPSPENKEKYRKYRNILTKIIKRAEEIYYRTQIDNKKKNLKALWDIFGPVINPNKKKQKKDICTINYKGKTITENKDIADAFNDHFINIGTRLNKNIQKDTQDYKKYLPPPLQQSIYMFPTNQNEISKIIRGLQNNKAVGQDGISNKLVKQCAEILPIITHLCNQIITTGYYPKALKIGKIIPIYKNNDCRDPNNYRPITLLSCINKIIEKIIFSRLYKFLEKHRILHENQFGFRQKHSTSHALIAVTELIRQSIENKELTTGVFLDLTKAFDLVNHEKLVTKLENYGIRGPALTILKSYLANRQQFVKIGVHNSELQQVSLGVPQGSVLGPLLFLVYINDLQNVSTGTINMFADDTCIFTSGKDYRKLKDETEKSLSLVSQWFQANNMMINENKTIYLVFRGKKPVPDILKNIKLNDKTINCSNKAKYLGIILDDKLLFNEHIKNLCQNLLKAISSFKVIKNWIPNGEKMKLYYAYFHSKINYGIEIYGMAHKKYVRRIERLQHRALKTLFNLDPMTPSSQLRIKYSILEIKDHFSVNVAKFVYKFHKKQLPTLFNDYFLNAGETYPNTRGKLNLKLPPIKTDIMKKSIKYQGACTWNNLTNKFPLNIEENNIHYLTNNMRKYFINEYKTML